MVQEGVKVAQSSIDKIRESVKYVRASNARRVKFAECILQCSLSCRQVRQDVPTRWNSTYLMIESALLFQRAFQHLFLIDTKYTSCPTTEEWLQAERIMKLLKPFSEISTLFSGTKYPTANLYFHGVWKIELRLLEELGNGEDVISRMATRMKIKFDKYWHSYSEILSIAIILDPRYKLDFVEFCLFKIDGIESKDRVLHIRNRLYSLFEEYMVSSAKDSTSIRSNRIVTCFTGDDVDEFDSFESEIFGSVKAKSQLDLYFEEPRLDRKQFADLEVLNYWKDNSFRYPELSLLARDILSIPITTVASESAFSIGGRILDKYRSSLLPQNAEALLCARDWLYGVPLIEEDLEKESLIEDFEELCNSMSCSFTKVT
ncbi:zinc finger BED domain-containing protein RICESLEEPER 2-like [Mercurialis annua]|uniref:zinc finger BED domain-containing protein RICESLEEPER 2-like n=1 Tax=Mercurialis annua TaxID=3986 RepID=UPI00215EB9A6|nr:zinc finger BED domain-containing protein RICESLEEPER 2-like [Mercurialis annua]